jgi:hypothetical protein
MALANIALTDTFDTWRVRTNQIIVALDQANTLTYNSVANSSGGFTKANAANLLAYNTSIGANTWANTVGSAVNSYAVITSTRASNNWANVVVTASNNRTTTVGTSANSYATYVGASANAYTDQSIGVLSGSTAANSYANTIGIRSNSWANIVVSYANTYALTTAGYANNYANAVGTRSNTWASYVGSSANNYANYVGVSSNNYAVVVGAAANTLANTKLANTSNATFNGNLYFPANSAIYTGTGIGSIFIVNNQINSGYNYNSGDGTLALNYTGYNNGTTQFRSLYVYDGKTSPIAIFAGSDKSLYVYGDVQAYYASDISLKNNITIITDALTKVNSIRGVEFDWSDDYLATRGGEDSYFIRKHDVGVIANEIEKVLPEAVGVREDGIKAVKYERIVPLLIEAIKELSREIEELKKGK